VNSDRIYLDNAATTPPRTEVADAMREAAARADYNPSSLHAEGRRARAVLDSARDRLASLLGAARNEILFASSGTEANNLALLGCARARGSGGHVVAAGTEHHSVLAVLARLREEGFATTVLPVGRDGAIDPAAFAAALHPNTIIASVMYANNETGTIQPVAELAQIARAAGVYFHADAVQAPCWLPIDVDRLGVDMLSLSAHKFHGPKGIGLLYVRRGVPVAPLLYGGSQEFGKRAGTPNVPSVAAMAKALELAVLERPEASPRIAVLRDRLETGISAAIADVRLNGAASRLPNISNVSFAGVDSAALLVALDLAGVAVSAGSACTSGSLEPSHVLAAQGLEDRWLTGAVRFSLGTATSATNIDRVLALLPLLVTQLRRPAEVLRGDG
jgi:cysteine desulfurase